MTERMEANRHYSAGSLRSQLLIFLAAEMTLWALCLVVELMCRLKGYRGAYTWPVFTEPSFGDFKSTIGVMRRLHTNSLYSASGVPFLYPAGAAPFQWIFAIIHQGTHYFLAASVVFAVLITAMFGRRLASAILRPTRAYVFAALLLVTSYPFLFCFDRGNIEIFIFALVAGAVWAILSGRYYLAAACIGIAGSAKIYPFILLAMLWRRSQWKALAASIAAAALYTLASLWLIHPHIAVAASEVKFGLAYGNMTVIGPYRPMAGGFDHSVVGVYKRLHGVPMESLLPVLNVYVLCAGCVALALWWFRWRKMPMENEVMGLVVAMVTIMPMSYDYTLLHIYVPLALLMVAIQRGRSVSPWVLAMLIVAVAPMTELMHGGTTFANIPRCAALLGLMGSSAWKPIVLSRP